jgi:type I restriction enzyme S subunit
LVDSPLGLVPNGWDVRPLADVADLVMGQSPPSEHYNLDKIGKPFHQGVGDFGLLFPTNRKYCRVDGRSAMDGDVLISVRAPVGRLNVADGDTVIGRGLAAARSSRGRQALLFRTLKEAVFAEEDSMGSGTIFKAIRKDELEQVRVLCAPPAVEDMAEAILADNLAMIRTLTRKNQLLVAFRDLLLPNLVTGKIPVSKLDLEALVEAAG